MSNTLSNTAVSNTAVSSACAKYFFVNHQRLILRAALCLTMSLHRCCGVHGRCTSTALSLMSWNRHWLLPSPALHGMPALLSFSTQVLDLPCVNLYTGHAVHHVW